MLLIIIIGIILILLFIIAFAFYMAARDVHNKNDWRSQNEDYRSWKLTNEDIN